MAYQNGGGTFLVPYLVMLGVLGLTVLRLELSLGQHFQLGIVHALRRIHPALGPLGFVMIFASFAIVSYYNTLMAWTLRFLFASFQSPLPWGDNNSAEYFQETVLGMTLRDGEPPTIDEASGLVLYNVLTLVLAWLMTLGAVYAGVKSSGKVVWVTVPLPVVCMVVLVFRGVSLEGAGEGLRFYLEPTSLEKLFALRTWYEAASQLFFSLSLAVGVMPAFASHNPRSQSVAHDTFIIALSNSLFSVISGIAVFSILGHLAHEQGVGVADVVAGGPGLVFVTLPTALALMPAAPFFAVLFFLMLLTLGIDSSFALAESCIVALKDATRLRGYHAAYAVCLAGFLCGLPFVSEGGIFYLALVDRFVAQYMLVPLGFCMVVGVAWVYGAERFAGEMDADTGKPMPPVWPRLWKYAVPPVLFVVFVAGIVDDVNHPLEDQFGRRYPGWALAIGYLIGLGPFVVALVAAAREFSRLGGTPQGGVHSAGSAAPDTDSADGDAGDRRVSV